MTTDAQLRAQVNATFRFVVEIGGEKQAAFTECTLPVIEWEVEEVKEGGVNTFIHQLPGRRKSARISLKNGVSKTSLVAWYLDTMQGKFVRKAVTVTLCDLKLRPVMAWRLSEAFPIKWSGPQLKSDDSAVAVQTLELACNEISIEAFAA